MNLTVLSLMLAAVIAPPAKTSNERSTRIYVCTTPPGASILLDGKELGTSDGLFLVPPGVRKITLEMDGYDPEAKTVDVKEGWITRVEVRMVKKAAGMTLDRDARVEEVKQMLARDTTKLDELLQSHGKQHPMVRLLETRIQAWKQILEDPSFEAAFDRLDERTAELLREIDTALGRPFKRETAASLDLVRTIYDLDDGQGQEAIDLDRGTIGKVYDLPKEFEDWNRGQREQWLRERGIDLIADFAANQWGLGCVQSAITLLPADDLDLNEVDSRSVNNLLAEKDERMGKMELHREGEIAFVLLPKDPVLPPGFVFQTSEGMKGFLQIIELNKEKPRSMKLCWQVTSEASKETDAPSTIEGVLEFRVAASQEEAKDFSGDSTSLGWYECAMESTNNLVTRQYEGRTQVLLWKTPEKSMTRSNGRGKKWQVIKVSVIAEPDKPGRVGVLFDEEGGRRLKKLTADNINRQMAILVDGRVMNCPTVRAPISSRVEITGNFSKADLNRLATALQAGMEPIRPIVPKPEP